VGIIFDLKNFWFKQGFVEFYEGLERGI